MTHYNLYYGTTRLNNLPISEEQLQKIRETASPNIRKMKNGEIIEIPKNKVRIVKCTIV